jgi:hypothetical protein
MLPDPLAAFLPSAPITPPLPKNLDPHLMTVSFIDRETGLPRDNNLPQSHNVVSRVVLESQLY